MSERRVAPRSEGLWRVAGCGSAAGLGIVLLASPLFAVQAPTCPDTDLDSGAWRAWAAAEDAWRIDGVTGEGPGLPPEWSVRETGGGGVPELQRIDGPGAGSALQVISRGAAAFVGREVDAELELREGRLTWLWRVDDAPDGLDLRDPERDDAPMRFFVTFGDGGLFSGPRTLFYTWGRGAEVGETWPHPENDRLRVVLLRDEGAPRGAWVGECRDLAADYRRAFGEGPGERVTGFGVLVDMDQSGGTARSRLGPVWFTPQGESARTPGTPPPDPRPPASRSGSG